MTFSDIQHRVAKNTPPCCRIGRYGDGGHFAVIRDWRIGSSGETYVDIADPLFLTQEVVFDQFPSSYQTGGDWTHTYLTTPASGGGAKATASTSPDPDTLGA